MFSTSVCLCMHVCLLVCFIIFYVYSCACLSSSIFAYVAVYIFVCVLAGLITSLFTCPKAICYMTEMLAIGNYSLNKKTLGRGYFMSICFVFILFDNLPPL